MWEAPRERRKSASDLRVRLTLRIARRKRRRRGVIGAPIGIRLGLQRSRILVHARTIVTVHPVFRHSGSSASRRTHIPRSPNGPQRRPPPSAMLARRLPRTSAVHRSRQRLGARSQACSRPRKARCSGSSPAIFRTSRLRAPRRRRRNRQAAREESVQQTQRREARTPRGSGADAGPSRTELIRRQTIPATGPLCPRGGTTRRRTATTVDAVGSDAPHAYVLSDSDRTAISA